MKIRLSFIFLIIVSFLATSCVITQTQKANRAAHKRYRHIKTDCNCHSQIDIIPTKQKNS